MEVLSVIAAIILLMDSASSSVDLHKKLGGKIATALKVEVTNENLGMLYTPGVAEVSLYAKHDPEQMRQVSWAGNLVAVISDGSAVLGLGDIGPEGAMPVMEGKAALFKHFAGIDAVPIVLNVHKPAEIIGAIAAIAPSFGAINLEDIAAPKCFEIEARLKALLDIPIMHDDQHGTAIVVLAALINAARVTGRDLATCKIVLVGAGAAGVGIARLLYEYASPELIVVDSKGIIQSGRSDLTPEKVLLMSYGSDSSPGDLAKALIGADIFIGVSQGGIVQQEMIAHMAPDPIIFALANPTPEIMPDEAKAAGAAVVATGRSDLPNQVNNALGFPGVFRGALDNGITKITDKHKLAAAEALAGLVDNPTSDFIIPSIFDDRVVKTVASCIR